jgi:ACS family D-galactonate transporter-like MFS transporter
MAQSTQPAPHPAVATPPSTFHKTLTVGLLWAAQLSSYAIRYALGVVAPTLMKLYHISPKAMGYLLSGWNWTYTGSMLFVGPIVDRFGAWIVLGLGSGIWGLTTVALPIFSTVAALFLMRAFFGVGQSMLIPATAAAVSRWFGPRDRATAIGVAYSGNQVGLAVGATIAAFILAHLGWRAVFYSLGGGSLLFTLAWFCFYPDKQRGGRASAPPDAAKQRLPKDFSWGSLFRFRSTWGIAFGQMGYLYAFYFFVTWLPGYLVLERKMTILQSGLIGSLPFLAGLLGTLGGGWLGDYLIRHGVSPTVSRKSIIGTGLTAATVTVIAAAFTERTLVAVTLLILCMGCIRFVTASVHSLPIDLAPPSLVGSLASIQNFSANVGGLLAPIVTGYIISSSGSFVWALVAAGGMALSGAISYVFIMGNLQTYQPPKAAH